MTGSEWAVLLAGVAAIAWVNWYFFLAGPGPEQAASAAGGLQQVTIAVEGGYSPAAVRVRGGVPIRLVFDRRERSSCSEEVVFPQFGVRRFLPAFEQTAVDLPAAQPGTYEFTCGMSMLHGTLIVE